MLSLPILRQKMAQSFGMMFIGLPDGCCYRDRNTSNTYPVSDQKITLNNQKTNNRMKQNEQNRNRSEFRMIKQNKWMQIWLTGKMTNNNRQIMNSKLAANNDADVIDHEQKQRGKCWLTYILWLPNWQLQPCLPKCLLGGTRCHAAWKPIEPPSSFVASYQLPQCLPIKFHNYNDSVTRAARILLVPTLRSRDIQLQAQGDHLDRAHTDEMVLEMIRRGRLVR